MLLLSFPGYTPSTRLSQLHVTSLLLTSYLDADTADMPVGVTPRAEDGSASTDDRGPACMPRWPGRFASVHIVSSPHLVPSGHAAHGARRRPFHVSGSPNHPWRHTLTERPDAVVSELLTHVGSGWMVVKRCLAANVSHTEAQTRGARKSEALEIWSLGG